MKKILLNGSWLIALFLIVMAFGSPKQDEQAGLGRVSKVLGKEVYMMCEPLKAYDVVDNFSTEWNWSNKKGIKNQVEGILSRAIRRNKNGKTGDFDAILINDDGDKGVVVKFK